MVSAPDNPPGLSDELSALGEPERVYPTSLLMRILCWTIGPLGLIIGIAIPVFLMTAPSKARGSETAQVVGIVVATVFLVSGGALLGWVIYARGLQYALCRDALVKLHRDRATIFRWSEIKSVREIYNRYMNKYVITRTDGQRLRLDYRVTKAMELGQTVQQRVLAHQLPLAQESLARGEVVKFGPLGVSKEGISYKGQNVPWQEVKSVGATLIPRANAVQLVIMQHGKLLPLCMLWTGNVPNFRLFYELVRRARPECLNQ
jgi:hypothetical protein